MTEIELARSKIDDVVLNLSCNEPGYQPDAVSNLNRLCEAMSHLADAVEKLTKVAHYHG